MKSCRPGAIAAALLATAFTWMTAPGNALAAEKAAIFSPQGGSFPEVLAAREVLRYLYLRTGELVPIISSPADLPEGAARILVARKESPAVRRIADAEGLGAALESLREEDHLLRTIERPRRTTLLITGGGPAGTLYGAYRFAEHLGVRFALHGDIVPSGKIPLEIPKLDDLQSPLFPLRGIQPFHDFPEGPDWWNLDDYKAILGQLPKLRMNFFGLHTYPEGHPNAEPTVWIGLPGEFDERGRVAVSYPSSYQNTLRGNWGYAPKKTSDYVFGSDLLFESDAFGADCMGGRFPAPASGEASNRIFNETALMLGEAFRSARKLGVKICVGTETPLTIPKEVQERLKAAGRDPKDPAVLEELYMGIFRRIERAYPIDYYWLWTPEGWTWSGTSEAQVSGTLADISAAFSALQRTGSPFQLATCGWVLGPPSDRALFDRFLPKEVPVSCINRQVGMDPVEPGFAKAHGRGKWAIPWLEDDPALTSPQLWAGRMREDAHLALRYGCSGLMGIHWRTRILAPNVLALAQAAWSQKPWGETMGEAAKGPRKAGPEGGQWAAFPGNEIAGTDYDPLYQTVRYDVAAYRFDVPGGIYKVTLKFCEPHYNEAGKRVFGVKIAGKTAIEKLDIFEKAAKDKALDFTFDGIESKDGSLDIEFVKIVEFPSIAAIAIEGKIEGKDFSRKVNCGGPAYKDYEADGPPSQGPPPRGFPADDFYLDWCSAEFGARAAPEIGRIFSRLDGRLPRPSDWVDGPGGLKPDPRKWEDVEKDYAFVEELACLRPLVEGPPHLERFDWWTGTFRYMKAMARVNCAWGELNGAMEKVKAEGDPEKKRALARETALPLREKLVGCAAEVFRHLLETVSNPGEMGTVMNWCQHILPPLLEKPGDELSKALGEPLPPSALSSKGYSGPPRAIVPTLRTSVAAGESLSLKVIFLGSGPPRDGAVFHREMGKGEFTREPLRHLARGVHEARLPIPPAGSLGIEYHVKFTAADGKEIFFPHGAPAFSQTLVVVPGEKEF